MKSQRLRKHLHHRPLAIEIDGPDSFNRLQVDGSATLAGISADQGDADGDADADGHDLLAWQRQFGSGSSVSRVPELGDRVLALLVCLFLPALLRCEAREQELGMGDRV